MVVGLFFSRRQLKKKGGEHGELPTRAELVTFLPAVSCDSPGLESVAGGCASAMLSRVGRLSDTVRWCGRSTPEAIEGALESQVFEPNPAAARYRLAWPAAPRAGASAGRDVTPRPATRSGAASPGASGRAGRVRCPGRQTGVPLSMFPPGPASHLRGCSFTSGPPPQALRGSSALIFCRRTACSNIAEDQMMGRYILFRDGRANLCSRSFGDYLTC